MGSSQSSGLSLNKVSGGRLKEKEKIRTPLQLQSEQDLSLLGLTFPLQGSFCGLKTSYYMPNVPTMWSLLGLRLGLGLSK